MDDICGTASGMAPADRSALGVECCSISRPRDGATPSATPPSLGFGLRTAFDGAPGLLSVGTEVTATPARPQ